MPTRSEAVLVAEAAHRPGERLVHHAVRRVVLEQPDDPAAGDRTDAVAELELGAGSRGIGLDADDLDARRRRRQPPQVARVVEEGEDLVDRRGDPSARPQCRHAR
jgi:hypothetical protein